MHGIRIATIFGIDVRADWSLAVIVWLLSWGLATGAFPSMAEGYTNGVYWLAGAVIAVLFLMSLLAHEISHSIVARRRGIRVRDITLWMFGGVSTLEGEARTPRDDFAIAIAGPATSVAVGGAVLAAAALLWAAGVPRIVVAAAVWLGSINLVLAVFNLAPAAPLDGGRVLRAWLWHRSGDHDQAAIKAARAGHRFAWVLIGVGLLEFALGGDIGGLWLIMLGWFLLNASRAEEMQVVVTHELRGVRVGELMTPDPITAPASITVADLLDDYVWRHRASAFPLTEPDGRVSGLVTLAQLKSVPRDDRAHVIARDVGRPIAEVTRADPGELLLSALRRSADTDGRILVFDDDRLVGIVTPTDVTRAVQLRA